MTTVDEARNALWNGRFAGAIVDLRLAGASSVDGNDVARQLHRDHLIPIAVVTGFSDELAPELRELAGSDAGFFRVFNKSGKVDDVFAFLFELEQSGVLQIMGPGGEMAALLSEIFWKHLGSVVEQWRRFQMDSQDRRRVLRHAVSHMMGALQSKDEGGWDNCLPGEVYIWPSICPNEMTGDIYKELIEERLSGRHFLLVTPACDLASKSTVGAMKHVVQILPFSDFPSRGKIESKLSKKEHRFHILPPTTFFAGGVIDFATLTKYDGTDFGRSFVRVGSLIEPYWREIVNRLSAWIGRQGTPEFDKEMLMLEIQKQWIISTVVPGEGGSASNARLAGGMLAAIKDGARERQDGEGCRV